MWIFRQQSSTKTARIPSLQKCENWSYDTKNTAHRNWSSLAALMQRTTGLVLQSYTLHLKCSFDQKLKESICAVGINSCAFVYLPANWHSTALEYDPMQSLVPTTIPPGWYWFTVPPLHNSKHRGSTWSLYVSSHVWYRPIYVLLNNIFVFGVLTSSYQYVVSALSPQVGNMVTLSCNAISGPRFWRVVPRVLCKEKAAQTTFK